MNIVVDASVAVKWAVLEDGHDKAVALITAGYDLLVLDFTHVEVANVLWKKVRRQEITAAQATAAAAEIRALFSELLPAIQLIERALEICLEIDHPVYDCLYVAAAEEQQFRLVTADRRLIKALSGRPYAELVVPLGASL